MAYEERMYEFSYENSQRLCSIVFFVLSFVSCNADKDFALYPASTRAASLNAVDTLNLSPLNDVMMQAFYWDVPVDEARKDGSWWDNLRTKAPELKAAGITGIWTPVPAKGN
ncbi:MAG: hypothetical protein LUE99_05765 [Bacteroides sp.]|nr:hypothetical protein [Bacteroides sp.]